MNPVFADLPTTIFERMSARARSTGAIHRGQGFPEASGPADVIAAAATALSEGSNQFPPMAGTAELRAAVAGHYGEHQGVALTPDEVIVTSGATEALAAAILALVKPGDEVVLIQPMYDSYLPMVRAAGGVPRFVSLRPPEWRLDPAELAAAFGPKTRAIVVNSPVNPAAAMFDAATLGVIAELCVRHDVVAICDEVWEHVVFDGAAHRSMLAVPGMRERTVKIGSAGKIFALTGWKVGWMCAAPPLARVVARAHQFLTFTTPPNLQAAVAYGLGKDDGYFTDMRDADARSRDRLSDGLAAGGYAMLPSAGTWFLSIDLAASGIALDDVTFCERIIDEAGVAAIPVSAFYAENPATHIVRLCFAKSDATLDAAIARLAAFRERLAQ